MYYKGIVLEVKENYCLVMSNDGAVFRIKIKEGLEEGQKIYFIDEDIYVEEKKDSDVIVLPFRKGDSKAKIKKLTAQKLIAVAAAFLICFSTLGIFNYNNQAYAAVSMDGSESLQFEINRKGNIVKIISYGDLLSADDLKVYEGMSIKELWNCFLDKDQSDLHLIGYIAFNGKSNTEKNLINIIKDTTKGADIIYLKGEKADLESAAEENLSIGRYMSTQFPDEDEFEEFLEHTTKESLLKYIENNKDIISVEEGEKLIQAKERYDEAHGYYENEYDDDDDDEEYDEEEYDDDDDEDDGDDEDDEEDEEDDDDDEDDDDEEDDD